MRIYCHGCIRKRALTGCNSARITAVTTLAITSVICVATPSETRYEPGCPSLSQMGTRNKRTGTQHTRMLQCLHTCNRARSQSSLKRSVITLLHVTVIHHRITLYKGYITPAASPAQHANQPVLRVIRWTVNGGFADMFLGSSQGYETSVLRHQMQLHLVHSLQLIHQLLPL